MMRADIHAKSQNSERLASNKTPVTYLYNTYVHDTLPWKIKTKAKQRFILIDFFIIILIQNYSLRNVTRNCLKKC